MQNPRKMSRREEIDLARRLYARCAEMIRERNALQERLAHAEAILDDPCHWCDPMDGCKCDGCTRKAPEWRGEQV